MPILCLFAWPVHSQIALPANAALFFRFRERDVVVRCTPLDGTRLFSYSGSDYSWLTERPNQVVYRVGAQRGEEEVPFREIRIDEAVGPFTGGVIDRARFARFEVSFELPDREILESRETSASVKLWAEDVANYFTDWYRVITNESDIGRIRIADAPIVDVFTADDYTFGGGEVSCRFTSSKRYVQWTSAYEATLFKRSTAAPQIGELDRALKQGVEVPLHLRLLLDAMEQAHLRQEYDLSIIVSQTALEMFLQQRLRSVCAARGILKLPRRKGRKEDAVDAAIERGNIKGDLLRWAEFLSGVNVCDTPEYSQWDADAYAPRNAAVHRGKRGATMESARIAFERVTSLIELLDRVLRVA